MRYSLLHPKALLISCQMWLLIHLMQFTGKKHRRHLVNMWCTWEQIALRLLKGWKMTKIIISNYLFDMTQRTHSTGHQALS